ncbi:PIN domain-containing protein [Agromyces sp. Soil535]|uniref:PIN domain-containing protein n=1 Tax=Agromyces sp. Soil535 TaxID=1736390 RepID=UPI0006F3B7F5|nr:PIN domain-containing protein [Agromyces sp. Soil535]KRE29551.1 hypothetical protein ASG80_19090 [Agromyces sp. Soil535]
MSSALLETPHAVATSSETRYLIDNSVWARLATDQTVQAAFEAIVIANRPSSILICPPVVAEYSFSARNGVEHDAMMESLSAFTECDEAPNSAQVLLVQNSLWNAGLVRTAGAMDTIIATYAIQNEAIIVHYDRDYELIARAVSQLQHQWIVPRGSL